MDKARNAVSMQAICMPRPATSTDNPIQISSMERRIPNFLLRPAPEYVYVYRLTLLLALVKPLTNIIQMVCNRSTIHGHHRSENHKIIIIVIIIIIGCASHGRSTLRQAPAILEDRCFLSAFSALADRSPI
jgi:hypothetical protein